MTRLNLHAIIIKLLLNNKYYNKYYNIILNNNKNNKYIYKLLLVLKELNNNHPKDLYEPAELLAAFHASYPALQKDEADYFDKFFAAVSESQVDDSIAEDMFRAFYNNVKADEVALLAVQVAQGQKSFEDLTALTKTLEEPLEQQEEAPFITTSILEIHNEKISVPGLRWRLSTLNRAIGSLRRGNFGFIAARPEAGKTTFLASEVTFMGTQTDGNVLWVNNEQPGGDVIWRCYNAYLGKTSAELLEDLPTAELRWNESFGSRLKFIDNPGITKNQIESICKQYDPKLIVFDQLDKVRGFDAERYDLKMKAVYQWARELSKMYGPVIGVCQAGGTAEGKRYLDMNDIDSSHTAKQGEADWIIGIGKDNSGGYEKMRYLSVLKNKLPGDEDTDPKLRHGKLEVIIDEELARYQDKIKW